MIITALTISNFKGIREPVRVEFKPITLLFGPNSAGKSTIIQALHYAREIFINYNLNPDRVELGGDSIDLGGFLNFVNNHHDFKTITLRFDIDYDQVDMPEYFLPEIDAEKFSNIFNAPDHGWVEIDIKWSQVVKRPTITNYPSNKFFIIFNILFC